MNTANVTIGCDPEVFLRNNAGFVSAVGLVGGSKEEPRTVTEGMLQEDNVMAEFGIHPAKDEEEFVYRIGAVLSDLEATVTPYKLNLDFSPTAMFDAKQLEHPAACVFGCEPDYNAWTLRDNEPPEAASAGNMRTAGGHVHVGFDVKDDMHRVRVVRMMDIYLGIPSVLLDWDTDRRQHYGRAGAHRPKSYGVEYRTLSNFWVKDEHYMRWVYRQSMAAVQAADTNPEELVEQLGGSDFIQHVINDSNLKEAANLVAALKIPLPVS